jgi:predicted lysophospholipase L1 biosynthesis ABC-type transport system permease subunit
MDTVVPARAKFVFAGVLALGLGVAAFWMAAFDASFFVDRPFLYFGPNLYTANYLASRLRALTHPEVVMAAAASMFLVPALLTAVFGLARATECNPLEVIARRVEKRHRYVVATSVGVAMLGAAFVAFALVKGDDRRRERVRISSSALRAGHRQVAGTASGSAQRNVHY